MAAEGPTLKEVFLKFANHGHTHGDDNTHLDNRQWAKLCRDAGIISKASPFTSTDADILFAKVKPSPSARRIGFDEFLVALRDVGAKMFDDVPDEDARFRAVERLVVATGGPAKGRVTEADDVRFYDRIGDDERARREKLEARERRRGEAEGGDATLLRAETFRRSSAAANRARGDPLRAAFLNFAHGYGHDAAARTADMDINRFIRMLRDSKLLDKPRRLNATEAELAFTRVCTRGGKKIGFKQVCDALRELGPKYFRDEPAEGAYALACEKIIDVGGPAAAAGTRADPVRLADEIEKQRAEREEKDAQREKRRSQVAPVDTTAVARETFARSGAAALDAEEGTLKSVFLAYGAFSHTHGTTAAELDNAQFIKLLTDCGLLKRKKLFDRTKADLLFTRVKHHGSRRIGFDEFCAALHEVASVLHPEEDNATAFSIVEDQVVSIGGPKLKATPAETPEWAKSKSFHKLRK